MSGRNQHHIPRFLLRGFLIDPASSSEQVCAYRKGRPPYITGLGGVGAQRDFNSRPSTDGAITLDDKITDYESYRLSGLVRQLRRLGIGSAADAAVAAEVVGHLAVRTAHMRSVFQVGMTNLIAAAGSAVSDLETVSRLIGLDAMSPNETFREKILEHFYADPMFSHLAPAKELMDQLVFWFARENFGSVFEAQAPELQGVLTQMLASTKDTVRTGHLRAVETSLDKPLRHDELISYGWVIEAAPEEGSILPDCVAVGINPAGEIQPLLMMASREVSAVVMPLSGDRLLVGRSDADFQLNLSSLNGQLAQCSHDFFVAADQQPAFEHLHAQIGSRSTAVLDEAVEAVRVDIFETPAAEASADRPHIDPALTEGSFSYDLRLFDFGDEDLVQQVNAVVQAVVSAVGRALPLVRLDGITFADDYPAALAELDRGLPGVSQPTTVAAEFGIGYAQAPLVVREGLVKNRIICRSGIAAALIQPKDDENRRFALSILVQQLAETALTAMVDTALPEVLLRRRMEPHEAMLALGLRGAHETYFTAMWGAGFADDQALTEACRDGLVTALDYAGREVVRERLAYREHGDLDRFLDFALSAVQRVLGAAARLHGHCDAIGVSALDEDGELRRALEALQLGAWFDLFRNDLQSFWGRAGRWESYDEFLAFHRHVERLLWQFGVFACRTPDGGSWIEIPLVVDGLETPPQFEGSLADPQGS
ncbi:MAG TPA: hypothetical protein VF138_01240 [Caulobacteraceae bacterium]